MLKARLVCICGDQHRVGSFRHWREGWAQQLGILAVVGLLDLALGIEHDTVEEVYWNKYLSQIRAGVHRARPFDSKAETMWAQSSSWLIRAGRCGRPDLALTIPRKE